VKTSTRRAKPRSAKRPKSSSSARRSTAKRTARKAAPAGKSTSAKRTIAKRTPPAKRAAARRTTKRATSKPTARREPAKRATAKRAPAKRPPVNRWLSFVEQHGVVLASARGPVPCVAEAVAGQPIIGSWWAHPKGKAIFAALSEIDDCEDVRCFKLIDGKVTFVHRRVWPALARLATDGVIPAGRVASIQQEHMPTGEHRNLITPFPDWVSDDVAAAARALTLDDARAQLGSWV